MLKTLESIRLFVGFDVLLIVAFTLSYLVYMVQQKKLSINYASFSLVFLSLYFVLFYVIKFRNDSDAQSLFLIFLVPSYALFHWLVPFKKNKTIARVLTVGALLLIGFWVFITILHYFSNM